METQGLNRYFNFLELVDECFAKFLSFSSSSFQLVNVKYMQLVNGKYIQLVNGKGVIKKTKNV